jgi:hypothetical protein
VSLLVLICCCRSGVCRSEALRRGLCGAFRAKRRRTPQRVLTPAIHLTSATSFSAHSLVARDDPTQAYFLRSWLSHGAAYLALPTLPELAPLDLRSPRILRDSALLPPIFSLTDQCFGFRWPIAPVLRLELQKMSPVRHHPIVADRSFRLQSENLSQLAVLDART